MSIKSGWVILLLLVYRAVSLPSDDCYKDSDCSNYPYDICHTENNFCTRKPLFPIFPMEIAGIVALCILSIIASAAGLGGGAFIITVMLGLFKFDAKQAIAMSNGMMFLNNFAVSVMAMREKHHHEKHKPLVDMNLALIFITPMLAGAFSGSIVAVLVPSAL